MLYLYILYYCNYGIYYIWYTNTNTVNCTITSNNLDAFFSWLSRATQRAQTMSDDEEIEVAETPPPKVNKTGEGKFQVRSTITHK